MCTDHHQFCLTHSPISKFCKFRQRVSNRKDRLFTNFCSFFFYNWFWYADSRSRFKIFEARVSISREKRLVVSSCLFVRLSILVTVRIYQRGFHWTDFRETRYWGPERKSVEKIQTWLKSDKTIGHLTRPEYGFFFFFFAHNDLTPYKNDVVEWNVNLLEFSRRYKYYTNAQGCSVKCIFPVLFNAEFYDHFSHTFTAYISEFWQKWRQRWCIIMW